MTTSRRHFLGTTSLGLLGVAVGGGAASKPADEISMAHDARRSSRHWTEQRRPNILLSRILPRRIPPSSSQVSHQHLVPALQWGRKCRPVRLRKPKSSYKSN